jgi:hypothetical protein
VAVTAHEEQGVGPSVAPPLDAPLHHPEPLGAAEALGLEDRGAQTSCATRLPREGQEAIPASRPVVTGLCLCAMAPVRGVLNIEHDDVGPAIVRGATVLEHHQSPPGAFRARDAVCEACARRV